MPVVRWDSLALEGAEATIGEDGLGFYGLRKRHASGTPLTHKRCFRCRQGLGCGRAIASEAGLKGVMAVGEAKTGVTAAWELVSTDFAIAAHCANTASMQWTSLHALHDCRH